MKKITSRASKAREARRPKLIFDGPYYTIEKIPLNYRVRIKRRLRKRTPRHGIDRDFYLHLERSIEEVHEEAEEFIEKYFLMPD